MRNKLKDDSVRSKIAFNTKVLNENMKVRAELIDEHDLESTNEHIGPNYMSNVMEDDGHYKVGKISKIQKIQYTISGVLSLAVLGYAIYKAFTTYLGGGFW